MVVDFLPINFSFATGNFAAPCLEEGPPKLVNKIFDLRRDVQGSKMVDGQNKHGVYSMLSSGLIRYNAKAS